MLAITVPAVGGWVLRQRPPSKALFSRLLRRGPQPRMKNSHSCPLDLSNAFSLASPHLGRPVEFRGGEIDPSLLHAAAAGHAP